MTRLLRRALVFSLALVFVTLATKAYAAPISGVGATASSELSFPGSFQRAAIHMVNGSGLTGTQHGNSPDGSMWLSTGGGCCGGTPDPNPTVTFDLGSLYNVGSMKVWNYNEINLTTRGVNTADILVAGTDLVFAPFIPGQAFTQAPGTLSDFSQTISLSNVAARYVRLTNMTHFAGGDNDFFGLSEVQFDGTLVGPPPPPPHPGLSPIRAAASSFYAPDGRLPEHAVNGNGLRVGNGHVTGPPGGTMWLSNAGDPTGHFEIDLRGVHNLNDVRIWNYNEMAGATSLVSRGVQQAAVYVAGADRVYGAAPVATINLAAAPGDANVDFSQVASLAGVQARYIKLDVLSNHGDPSFAGLSEVKVTGTPAGPMPLPATIESVSSNIAVFGRPAEAAISDAGMGVADTHSINPSGRMWLNQGTFANVPPEQFDTNPEITFDMGSEVALSHMKVFNYNEIVPTAPQRDNELLGRGVQYADILVAGEDMVFSPFIPAQEFLRAPGNETTDFGQIVDLAGVVARYVKLDILANHNGRFFDDPSGDDMLQNFAGLSEVQFFQVPVPEPATHLLLVLGLLVTGLGRRAIAKGS